MDNPPTANSDKSPISLFVNLVESHPELSNLLKTELGAKIAFEVLEEAFDFKVNVPNSDDWDNSMILIDDPICKLKKALKSIKYTNTK